MFSTRFYIGMALFMSLALNAFFIGGLVPHGPGPGMRGPHKSPAERMLESATQLPAEKREKVTAIIASYRPAFDAQLDTMRTTREQLNTLISSPNYDRSAVDKQFDAMQDEMTKMQAIAKTMMLDVNDLLTPEERILMMPPKRDGKDGPPPPRD